MTQVNDEWLTIPEIVQAARAKLPANVWHYSCGGAESETTLRRNRSAFEYLALRPRVLQGVGKPDTSTTFLGQQLSLPVMLAPVGSPSHFHPDGALACAQAAERAGTGTFVGTLSTPSMEEVRSGAEGPLFFQLYVRGDRDWIEGIVDRVERAGYEGICLTADSAAYGRRERDLHNRYFPREGGTRPNLGPSISSGVDRGGYQAELTWDDVSWLREKTRLPLMVKGLLSPEDAEAAVDRGVDVVYVSNQCGRQLDHGPATIEVLPEMAKAVGHRARIVVDSGFMRGTDVIKALALGADAVCIGKLMTWGLGAGGIAGLERVLELLKTEMSVAMTNLGAKSIAEIGPHCVRPTLPPLPAPWPVGPWNDPGLLDRPADAL